MSDECLNYEKALELTTVFYRVLQLWVDKALFTYFFTHEVHIIYKKKYNQIHNPVTWV